MGIAVTCCRCGGEFDERTLKGTWLNRTCPLCGKRLSESLYDQTAQALVKAARESAHEGAPDTARKPKESKQDIYLEGQQAHLEEQLARLARARYYTSEWFRMACARRGSEAGDKGLAGLRPSYDSESAVFTLVPGDADRPPEAGWGQAAEYRVFDAIRAEVARKKSPLAGARLLPQLEFPWLPGQKPKQWGARWRAEVDCVLLTPAFACVVEVKRHVRHITVSRDFQHAREHSEGSRTRSASEVFTQIENGAQAFQERQQLYPADRVFKLVVYVDALSFKSRGALFRDGNLASYLDANGKAGFLEALRNRAHVLEAVATAGQVKELAQRLLKSFGNTGAPSTAHIVQGCSDGAARGLPAKQLAAERRMLDVLEARTRNTDSPLFGAQLLRFPVCAMQQSRGAGRQPRQVEVPLVGLLLARSHAVLVDARHWPLHVNTHAPFATVYVGDPAQGARHVDDAIRHDWDLASIHYANRSAQITLPNRLMKCIEGLGAYREHNRVCLLIAFVNPASFFSDCADFRQRAFAGCWTTGASNIVDALERLVASGGTGAPPTPIVSQEELDALASRLT